MANKDGANMADTPTAVMGLTVAGIMLVIAALLGGYAIGYKTSSAPHNRHKTLSPMYSHKLSNVPNQNLTAMIIDYEPGGDSSAPPPP